LKPARGVLASQKPNRFTVSDDDFRLVVSVYHLAFPASRLFFNTRESYDLNIALVAAGDLFTVDCETLPGAYLRRHLPGQFSTHDYPPRRNVMAALEQRGLAGKYLAEEMPCEIAPAAPAAGTAIDEKRWMDQHAQVRARLQDWEMALAGISHQSGKGGALAPPLQGPQSSPFPAARTVHQPTDCAGREMEGTGVAPAAGLKPRPSGPQTKTEEPGEKSGSERFSTDGCQAVERQAADASLREILEYFKTVLTSHCRKEESELFPAFYRDAELTSKLAAFRAEHERFGVDLDKFERQMVSYGLSRDPTVLLTLGARMIREMRAHLEAEEQLWSSLFDGSPVPSADTAGHFGS
jgi:hypothetical protein